MRVAIDAGHSWVTAGKRTPKFEDGSFMHEFAFNSVVAQYLNEWFRKTKIQTFTTYDLTGQTDYRYGSSSTDYTSRVGIANQGGADLFVSIHANAIGNGIDFTPHYGILFLADETRQPHVDFAQTIIDQVAKIYPRNKVLQWIPGSTSQSLCKYSLMPTAIIECGFMTNREDAKLLLDDEYRRNVAYAIYLGIISYAIEHEMVTDEELKEIMDMNEQTRMAAIDALQRLALKGFVTNPQDWEQRLEQSIPVWAFFIIVDRIVHDYGVKIDEFDKYMGGV